jgi:beta-glucosidase
MAHVNDGVRAALLTICCAMAATLSACSQPAANNGGSATLSHTKPANVDAGADMEATDEAFPFQDTTPSMEDRVKDLVSRLTLEEKVSQMLMDAPAIDRLGIPAYHWWSEALHGVARNGEATVFPQAIGMAATFDTDVHYQMAQIIAVEARAKHHEDVRLGKRAIYMGLDLWSPNINIFRDPRWGRGQETYGEDPYLTGRFGVAFVKGLQGEDPKYFETIATPKHYAVHSGPEPERHRFDAVVSEADLWTTYLPAFEASIREGKAFSIMGAYNSVDGLPCCANPRLLTDILRKQWGFQGYVVTDVGAARNIYQDHQAADTPEQAAAMAVKAGCDLGGDPTYKALVNAVHLGLITEAEIDISVSRLFMARFKMGMFDPLSLVAYQSIPLDQNDTKEHDAVAFAAARESMVLLKNTAHALPWKNEFSSIAVIGPTADSIPALVGNYNGTPSHPVTILQGIRNAVPATTHVIYAQGSPLIEEQLPLEEVVPTSCLLTEEAANPLPGLKANYFDNLNLSGRSSRQRVDAAVDFNWTASAAKEPEDLTPGFSAIWTGVLVAPESGRYQLGFAVRDGVRLLIDDKLILDDWTGGSKRTTSTQIDLEKGKHYKMVIQYFRPSEVKTPDAPVTAAAATDTTKPRRGKRASGVSGGAMADQDGNVTAAPTAAASAVAAATQPAALPTSAAKPATPKDDAILQLRWTRPSSEPFYADAVRAAEKAEAVVLVLGITSELEREESFINDKGFSGGDRTSLDLPPVQEELLEKVMEAAKGKPVTLVLTNGSALSVNWANDHVPSILEAWYPGQRGGDAVADILFGKYNPAGRLPVTFYKSVTDLPAFDDYRMQGRTYRYFSGEALYPFGYGLSYTTFAYSDAAASTEHVTTASNFSVDVKVKNTGTVAGDEVAQLYLSHDGAPVEGENVPRETLVGFKRVMLQPGEEKTVTFTVTPLQMAVVTAAGKRQVEAGGVTLHVGANSAEGKEVKVRVEGETVEPTFGFIAPTVR